MSKHKKEKGQLLNVWSSKNYYYPNKIQELKYKGRIFVCLQPCNIEKDWKAIHVLESAYSFMLKYSKITV